MAQQIAVAARTIVPSRMLRLLPRTPVCPTHVLGQPVVCVLCVCHLRIFFNHCHTVHCRTTVTNGPTTMFDNARSFGLFIVGDQAQCSLCRDRRVHKIHRVVRTVETVGLSVSENSWLVCSIYDGVSRRRMAKDARSEEAGCEKE